MYGFIADPTTKTLKDVSITDDVKEQIKIGRSLAEFYKDKYEKTAKLVYDVIDKKRPGISLEEKENLFYRSVYDYWTFGCPIDEEFRFGFFEKSWAERDSYITQRWHHIFVNHINANTADRSVVDDKYKLYTLLPAYFKRKILMLTDDPSEFTKFSDFVKRGASYVVKPLSGCQTLGVYKITIEDDTDLQKMFDKMFEESRACSSQFKKVGGTNIVVEEWIEQDERLSAIHPSSVNGVRIATFRKGDDVRVFYPWLKIGVGGADCTGSEYFGSMDALIDVDTGVIITDGSTKAGARYPVHPDTGVAIKGFKIPRWDECVALAKELALKLDCLEYVGWDLALSRDGWVVVEGNSNGNFNAQWMLGKGLKYEMEDIIGWKPEARFWWEIYV